MRETNPTQWAREGPGLPRPHWHWHRGGLRPSRAHSGVPALQSWALQVPGAPGGGGVALQPGFGSGVLGTLLPPERINTSAQCSGHARPDPIQFAYDLGQREAQRPRDAHPARPRGPWAGSPPAAPGVHAGGSGTRLPVQDTWHREGPACPPRGLITRNVTAPPCRGSPKSLPDPTFL